MKKTKLILPIMVGLLVGQIFAEGDRPFSVINTIRFGYNDNVNRSQNDPESSSYIEDIIDFAFNASLSERTDLVVKSQVRLKTDTENNIHPNIYAVLSHSVSPRTLLRVSEKFKSSEKTTGKTGSDGRYNYYNNNLGVVGTYVLSERDRLELSLNHSMRRHDEEIEDEDSTTIEGGLSWARDIRPQRTSMSLNLRQRMVEYDNRDSSYDATEISGELSHTFNPEWQGTVELGGTHVRPDLPAPANSDAHLEPLIKLGVTYSPSPRTRVTGNFSQTYDVSDSSQYGGKTARVFTLGFQHDLTAKLMAKAIARKLYTEYDENDNETGGGRSDEERLDLDFRLTYKLNRINFLEMGVKHSEKTYDDGDGDWTQNMFDVGWRVEL
ncbi:MAG: outer membrane beta-barrel protein [Verrucomicrobia bacterium]|nr:outer membrane beta-barrel protein [Verrucomicrobiota bacterium]